MHCCRDVVCLPTPWDVVRIVRETGANPYKFLEFLTDEEVTDVAKNDPTWLECDGERYVMALRRGKKGCYFLNKRNGLCKIYDARPILCRLYPFNLHQTRDGEFKSFTLHENIGCPKDRGGTVKTRPLYDLYIEDCEHQEDYNDLVRVFNRREYRGKKPKHFVRMFIKGLYG